MAHFTNLWPNIWTFLVVDLWIFVVTFTNFWSKITVQGEKRGWNLWIYLVLTKFLWCCLRNFVVQYTNFTVFNYKIFWWFTNLCGSIYKRRHTVHLKNGVLALGLPFQILFPSVFVSLFCGFQFFKEHHDYCISNFTFQS